jgi:hypothetical protein
MIKIPMGLGAYFYIVYLGSSYLDLSFEAETFQGVLPPLDKFISPHRQDTHQPGPF